MEIHGGFKVVHLRDFGAVEAKADKVESVWVKWVEMSDKVIPCRGILLL